MKRECLTLRTPDLNISDDFLSQTIQISTQRINSFHSNLDCSVSSEERESWQGEDNGDEMEGSFSLWTSYRAICRQLTPRDKPPSKRASQPTDTHEQQHLSTMAPRALKTKMVVHFPFAEQHGSFGTLSNQNSFCTENRHNQRPTRELQMLCFEKVAY